MLNVLDENQSKKMTFDKCRRQTHID